MRILAKRVLVVLALVIVVLVASPKDVSSGGGVDCGDGCQVCKLWPAGRTCSPADDKSGQCNCHEPGWMYCELSGDSCYGIIVTP
jgi:hypothetical protein